VLKYPSQHHTNIRCAIPFHLIPIHLKIFQFQFNTKKSVLIQLILFQIFQFPLQFKNCASAVYYGMLWK